MKLKLKVSQRVHKYITVEVEHYDDYWYEIGESVGEYITTPDDYDDFDCKVIEVIEE